MCFSRRDRCEISLGVGRYNIESIEIFRTILRVNLTLFHLMDNKLFVNESPLLSTVIRQYSDSTHVPVVKDGWLSREVSKVELFGYHNIK